MGSLPTFPECHFPSPLKYPAVRRDETVVDDYHGVLVADPYRWLEDPDSTDTKAFIKFQASLTDKVLTCCDEERTLLREKLTAMMDHPRYTTPVRRGGKCFYMRNSGLQAQWVLYVDDEVLVDPNGLSDDGTVALGSYSVSIDGSHVAYGLTSSGSDWVTIRVIRVDDRVQLQDAVSWVKFSSICWTHDGKGFFYSRFPSPGENGKLDAGTETNINLYHQLYYHFLGTDQSEDIMCWRDMDHPKYLFEARVTDDGKYCLLYIEEGCSPANKLYYCDLSSLPGGLQGLRSSNNTTLLPFTKLVDSLDATYKYVANDGTEFTFLTNNEAPKSKIVRVDLTLPEAWSDVVQESEKDVLEWAVAVNGNQMLVSYISDVKCAVQVRDLETGKFMHKLPLEIGTVLGMTGRRSDASAFIGFTSFLTPGIIYRCDLANEAGPKMEVFREIAIPGFNRSDFQVKQAFSTSRDGTKVPMFIFAKKGIPLDGSHPTLLLGYGGFSASLTPSFNVSRVVLARHLGVVFSVANIRGGGEYGEEWHRAGSLSNKQNSFDDFISAAEYLVRYGYTSPEKLCIEGRSNGGLLIAACINQRPDLFGCALAHVGVMDMMRFHRFTIGHAWTTEFGCSEKEEEFKWLLKYSPLHNVRRPWEKRPYRPCQYPSTMLLTADHDDRVVPLHSLKMLATMQHVLCTSAKSSQQTNPIIARIDSKAGHGCGRPTQKTIDEAADRYGFMAKALDATWIS